jgi:hypothetical protein
MTSFGDTLLDHRLVTRTMNFFDAPDSPQKKGLPS